MRNNGAGYGGEKGRGRIKATAPCYVDSSHTTDLPTAGYEEGRHTEGSGKLWQISVRMKRRVAEIR